MMDLGPFSPRLLSLGLSFLGQQAAVFAEGLLPLVASREGCSLGLTWAAFGPKSGSATVSWAREGSQAQVLPPVTEGSPLSIQLFRSGSVSVPTNDETDQL